MSESIFITEQEVAFLCDTPLKSLQIEHLRKIGVPFQITRTGKPRVARCYIEGQNKDSQAKKFEKWSPNVLRMV